MPAYLNDDELLFALRACRQLEDIAVREAAAERPSGTEVVCASCSRRAEARGKVH